MARLVGDQPKTLLEIVKYARKVGWKVPTSKELAPALGIGERAASARIKRLIDNQPDCFISQGRDRFINQNTLCTEKETAVLFLKIYELASDSSDGRIPKEQIVRNADWLSPPEVQAYIEVAYSSGYIQRVVANPDEIRIGPAVFEQLEYLRLLAET